VKQFLCILITAVTLLFSVHANSQSLLNPVSADAWSGGGSSVTEKNVFSVFNNPSITAETKQFQLGLFSEQRFNETKLTTAGIALVIPTKWIHIGLGFSHFGYTLFNQQKCGITISKKLSKQFSAGVTFSFLGTFVSEQPYTGNIIGELGLFYKYSAKLHFGIFILNPAQNKYSVSGNEKIPTLARLGIEYSISDKLRLILETEQMLNADLVYRGGIKYQIHELFLVSVGAANNPVYLTFGCGIKLKQFKINYAAAIHEVLGYSPHLDLIFSAEK